MSILYGLYSHFNINSSGNLELRPSRNQGERHLAVPLLYLYYLRKDKMRNATLNPTRRRLDTDQFITLANQVHNDLFDYSEVKYTGTVNKVAIICKEGHNFSQVASEHLRGTGCTECNKNRRASKLTKLKNCEAIERHGVFQQEPCRNRITKPHTGGHKSNSTEFINRAMKLFGDKYDYTDTKYIRSREPVSIRCVKHNQIFSQIAGDHLRSGNIGSCPQCRAEHAIIIGKSQVKTTEMFISRAMEKHGDRYSYENAVYINCRTDITITCKKHGDFCQRPNRHTGGGSGCPKCSHNVSNIQLRWLSEFNCPEMIYEYRIPTTPIKADGFIEATNTMLFFHGDYWHGNPRVYDPNATHPVIKKKTFGELYQKTLEMEERVKRLGYNLIVMWEMDYRQAR